MKKLALLLAMALGASGVYAQEAYKVLNDGVLTFYYDEEKESRVGEVFDFGSYLNDAQIIRRVVFDSSISNFQPIGYNIDGLFRGYSALAEIEGINYLNTQNVISLVDMFKGCSSLTSLDLSSFKTENVTILYNMFSGCSSLTSLDVSNFNTSNVINMQSMFEGCSSLTSLDLKKFDTAKVGTFGMQSMFEGCSSLTSLDLSSFNTENVTTLFGMFKDCTSLKSIDLSSFNTKNLSNIGWIFYNCSSLESLDLSNFDTSNITDMSYLFSGCKSLKSINLNGFNTNQVTNMESMFYGCNSLESLDLSSFNTNLVTNMNMMFSECSSLQNLDLSNFNTKNVTDMGWMFNKCSNLLTLNVSNFDTSNVLNMECIWQSCSSLTSLDLSSFNTENVTNMEMMFQHCYKLKELNISSFNTSKVTSFFQMFIDCYSLESLDVSSFNTESATGMRWMFGNCSGLTSLDVSNFNTSNVQHFGEMFNGCSNLESLDVSNFNTQSAQNMWSMFVGCQKLTSLDLSNFNTENVTAMQGMFENSSNIRTIYVGDGWSTANVSEGHDMFIGCTSLVGGKGTHYDADHIDYTYARIDGGPNSQMPGYFTRKGDAPWVDPNALVLTGKIDNYWYDETGGSDGFDAIIISVALPPGEVSVWESNVLNSFIANKLAFTTQDGEPVDNVEGRILFTEKDHWKTFDGGRILVCEDADMQGEVAEIDPESGMLRILNTDVTRSLLSATDRYVSLPLCVKAYIADEEVSVTNGSFTVMATKPLSFESISQAEVSFGMNQDVSVSLDELIRLKDWRNQQLIRNDSPDLYEHYRVDNPIITGTENGEEPNTVIMTNLNSPDGSLRPLSEVAPYLAVSYNPDLNHGTLTFVNYGNIPGSFTMYVPVTINHEWGSLSDQVVIKNGGDMPHDSEPYAVLSENNTVLTFYYDDKKAERNGMDVGPFYARNNYDISSGWFEHRESITNAVFDESFANCTTITNTDFWFYLCNKLTTITGLGNLKTDNVTSMWRMFDGCSSLTSLDVSGFNTSNVTNMQSMFEDCSSLTSLDVSHFNTSNVTNMFVMFRGCSSLTSLDVTNFDTSNVRDMHGIFHGLSSITNLDLSHFDTRNVTEIGEMFRYCTNLTSIDLSRFNTDKVTEMWGLFEGCQSLKGIDISNFNTESLTDMQHMFFDCNNLVYVNLSSFNTSKVTEFEDIFRNCTSLAAIHVGNASIPAEEYARIQNPNLLLYVNEARLAPEGVQNVVVNGVAKEIVLKDAEGNNNWYCPEPFRAEKISYTRDFRQQTQIGISRGWESLALPFAVQTITHQDKGAIAPFGSDASGLHFWLRRLGHEGLISVQMIEPNTPYIISMPNSEDYASRFNLNGRVTFAAEDAYVERTEQMADESADYMMVPAFQRMPVSEYVYALNVGEERNGRPEGSIFERSYREVRPFEAYTLHRGDRPAPLFFDLSDLEGSTTDMPDVRWKTEEGSDEWVTLDGRKLQKAPTAKGVYIYNGRKTVVK